MYSIDNNNITITRGDSASFILDITSDSTDLVLDNVLFILKNGSDVLVTRKIKDKTLFIIPSDTAGLPYGTYEYDIIVGTETAIKNAKFIIEKEVTF